MLQSFNDAVAEFQRKRKEMKGEREIFMSLISMYN